MVHFVDGACLRSSGVKLQQNCKQSCRRDIHLEGFIWFLQSGASPDHQHDYFQSHKPESENMPPTRKAADLTRRNSVWRGLSPSKGRAPNGFSKTTTTKEKSQLEKRLHESGRRYAPGGEEPGALNHNQGPQMPQRREQRASQRCHLKPGEAETICTLPAL